MKDRLRRRFGNYGGLNSELSLYTSNVSLMIKCKKVCLANAAPMGIRGRSYWILGVWRTKTKKRFRIDLLPADKAVAA